jgi:surface protein
MENLFYNCTSLEYVNFSNLNTVSVRTMVGMFYNCIILKTLDLSSFDTNNVESMENMFYGAKSLYHWIYPILI